MFYADGVETLPSTVDNLGGGREQVGTDHHLVVGVEATKGVTERRRLGVTPTAWNIATEPTEAAGADRLEPVLTVSEGADHHRDYRSRQPAEDVPQDRVEGVVVEPLVGDGFEADHEAAAARCRGGARPRGTAGDGGADVDEVAVAAVRPEDAVGENDGVRFGPGNLITERWPFHQLAGAGPGGTAPQIEVGVHEPATLLSETGSPPKALGVEQVERGDVERGGHGHFRTRLDQPEVEARLSVVEASVDVGSRDVEQPLSTERPGGTHHHSMAIRGPTRSPSSMAMSPSPRSGRTAGFWSVIACPAPDGDDDFPSSGSRIR